MADIDIRAKVLNEIKNVPEDKLESLYEYVQRLGSGLQAQEGKAQDVMKFAGIWQDLSEKEFSEFIEEIHLRRRQAFGGRPRNEAGAD